MKTSQEILPADYSVLLIEVKERIRSAQLTALRDTHKPIGVATYRLVKRLPAELKGQLPAPAEIAKLLDAVK